MRPYIVFDIETKKTNVEVAQELKLKDEAAAFDYPHKLGFGVAVTYDSATGEYTTFTSAQKLAHYLLGAKEHVLITFNGRRFDIPVLLDGIGIGLYDMLQKKMHLDLLQDFYERVHGRFRVSLDNMALNTMGVGKVGNGADAPLLFKQGRMAELIAYCKTDVAITTRLLKFGLENKKIAYFDKFENKVSELAVDYGAYLEDLDYMEE